MEEKEISKKEKVVPFVGTTKNLGKNEFLDFDNSAYNMLHRASTEWPCLSCDFLSGETRPLSGYQTKNPICQKDFEYPLEIYGIAGSQASLPSKNKIYVMRMANLCSTKYDDDPEMQAVMEGEDYEEFNDGNPIILHRSIPIKGGINRIRSMQGYPIIAAWSETRQIKIFDINNIVEELKDCDYKNKAERKPKDCELGTLSNFKHKSEGYALEWSPIVIGLLAAGNQNGEMQLYEPADENCSGFKQLGGVYGYHQDSIEDIQFCPNDPKGIATCGCDGTVKFIDMRQSNTSGPRLTINADECDINVISWNKIQPNLFASGADNGSFKVFDLRYPGRDPICYADWHEDQITSLEWQPDDEWTMAVASADNRLSIWDFSVEDNAMNNENLEIGVPEQVIFLHQGQENIKELRWSPYLHNTLMTTALNGFNLFQPGTDQEVSEDDEEDD